MKIIKSITHKLITAALLVLTGFSFTQAAINANDKELILALKNYIEKKDHTELFYHKIQQANDLEQNDIDAFVNKHLADLDAIPRLVIQSYVNTKFSWDGQAAHNLPGNVLAYENYAGQTIVLKSGNSFPRYTPSIEKLDNKVIVVSLEDIVAIVGSDNMGHLTNNQKIFDKYQTTEQALLYVDRSKDLEVFEKEIEKYFNLATEYQDVTWENYFIELNYPESPRPNLEIIKNRIKATPNNLLMNKLVQLRHTEFQVQALLTRYNKMKTESSRSNIKEIIKLLLPKVFVEENCQNKIHSLFEACKSCKQVNWLQIKKSYFICHVLDGQIQAKQITNQNTGNKKRTILTPPLSQNEVERQYTYVP